MHVRQGPVRSGSIATPLRRRRDARERIAITGGRVPRDR
ncbi:hypothetical protein LA76x_1883 [Lysobacter antibioticus]|uniref:Uncharacterized protein n=1 Tax=Lysobacter antibioticus TaxID=84531 RepID=A0A0S2F900_LYSAN|nr:hypothetical protein LA76x_1883 [Lysobacter antibioticus]